MIDIGINYITENSCNKYNYIYKFLVQNKYINTIKFPGKYCDYKVLQDIQNLAKELNIKLDFHGLPNMVPSIHSTKFIQNVDWKQIKETLNYSIKITRLSTHIGLENKDKLTNYDKDEIENNLQQNINNLKHKMFETLGNNVEIGVENIPGGFEFDINTLTPDFISNTWKKADFGVFDITHAKLAADELKMSYKSFIEKIENKDKIKILHISGNIDKTNKYINKPDKHVLINEKEICDIIQTIKKFNNLELVVSEYAYNTKYSYEKELIIEAIVLYTIVKTMDEEVCKNILKILENKLEEDISNINQILESKEWKIVNKGM